MKKFLHCICKNVRNQSRIIGRQKSASCVSLELFFSSDAEKISFDRRFVTLQTCKTGH